MGKCIYCGKTSERIASVLSICPQCIRKADTKILEELGNIHGRGREKFTLPTRPPKESDGLQCSLCQNKCRIKQGQRGYCGVRRNEAGVLKGGTAEAAVVSWYFDPLPTNCVAQWVCPGGTGLGYPDYAYSKAAEQGYLNMAVFYEACTFDCLFCQNWHYRNQTLTSKTRSADELARSVTPETSCICFFGGDPTCQLPHALAAAKRARRQNSARILRICWETNGSMNPRLLDKIMDISLQSGGCVKFDLKAWDENIHFALCGVSNRQTLENFSLAAKRISERPEPPPLVASTLLVPGYIDTDQVKEIARFIAGLNPEIPYALLGFHGDFLMKDLPATSRQDAETALGAAKSAGLKNVRLGNIHLFS